MTLLLIAVWPATVRLPPYRNLAACVAIIGLVMFGASIADVVIRFPSERTGASLIPARDMPKTQAEARQRSVELVETYPEDPRSHLYRGLALTASHDYASAERELRTALTQVTNLHSFFKPSFENGIRGTLAGILVQENRWSEAKEMARPACHVPEEERPPAALQKLMTDQNLCSG